MKTNVELFEDALKVIRDALSKKLVIDRSRGPIDSFLMTSTGPRYIYTDSDGDWQGGYTALDLSVRDMVVVLKSELEVVQKEKDRAQRELDAALKRKADLTKKEEDLYNKLAGVNGL